MDVIFQNFLSWMSALVGRMFPLLICALFMLLLLLGRKSNAKRGERWKNAFFPYLALIFGVAACLSVNLLDRELDGLLNNSMIRPYIDSAFSWLNLSHAFSYGFLVAKVIVINLGLAISYVAVKYFGIGLSFLGSFPIRLIRWTAKKLKKQDSIGIEDAYQEKKKSLRQKYLELFYRFNAEEKKAYIKPKFIKICKIFRLAAYILMGAYFLLLVAVLTPVFKHFSWFPYEFFTNILNAVYLYPVISLIVLFEITDFLDGADLSPEELMRYDQDTDFQVITNYNRAQNLLAKTFPDRYQTVLSTPDTVGRPENTDVQYVSPVVDRIRAFCQGDISSAAAQQKPPASVPKPVRTETNAEILRLIDSLEQGKDCLASASLFADMADAFMVYMHIILCCGKNVLVLCADDSQVQNVSAFITARLNSINQFSPVWIIKTESKAVHSGDCDVLVTTPTSLQDDSVIVGQEQFFEHVRLILVPNTVKMLISYASAFSWLVHRFEGSRTLRMEVKEEQMKNGQNDHIASAHPVSYLFLNQGLPEELRNTLESITDRSLSIHECHFSASSTVISLWNEESGKLPSRSQERLFGQKLTSPYIGFMLPLALSSYKLTHTDILLLSDWLPYRDATQSLESRAYLINEYLGDEQGLASFERSISFQGGFDAERDPVIIIEDELRNLPCAVREACHYCGARSALVHIVSAPYLLRDFFQSRLKDERNISAKSNGIFPLYIQSDAVRMKNICSEFRQAGKMTEDRLLRELSEIEVLGIQQGATLEDALRVFRNYIMRGTMDSSLQYDFIFDWEETFNERRATFEHKRVVKLRAGEMMRTILSADREATLCFGSTTLRLGFSAENIFQRYIPGQTLVRGGKMYAIDSINASEGVLYASAAPESLESPTEFIQNREYTLSVSDGDGMEEKWNAPGIHYGSARLTAALLTDVKIQVNTPGYYSILSYDPAVRPASMLYHELSREDIRTVYREFNGPVTVFRLATQAQADTAKASVLLAVVLQELCKTFFPYCWQEIAVCPVSQDASDVTNSMPNLLKAIYPTLKSFPFPCDPNEICVVLIQDSRLDNGIAQTLKKELEKPYSSLLQTALEYLEWVKDGHIDRSCFLCYGEDKLPGCFDLPGLIAALRELPRPENVPQISSDQAGECCCYCGARLGARYYELKDSAGRHNRKICQACKDGLISDKTNLDRLYAQAVSYLTDGFGISLPDDIKVRFASARKIRRKIGTGDVRSVLGFAYIKKNEIWVETLAPEMNIMEVLVHELTHIWQNNSLDFGKTNAQTVKEYKEGHSSLMEVRYLFDMGRRVMASRTLQSLNGRNDAYGKGFRKLVAELDGDYQHSDPFAYMKEKFSKPE